MLATCEMSRCESRRDIRMITVPELVSQALGAFLTAETRDRFGASHAGLTELLPFAAKLTLECIGNSDALYRNIEHTLLVTLAGHDILTGRALLRADHGQRLCELHPGLPRSRHRVCAWRRSGR